MIKYIYFIRHGQYVMDKNNEEFGRLTDLGKTQCVKTGQRLKSLSFDLILASPMERAQQSAQIICEQIGGDFVTKKFLKEGVPSLKIPVPESLQHLNEEKVHTDQILMNTAVDFLANSLKADSTLIIAHGNLTRFICQQLLGLPPNTWYNFEIANASLTKIRKKDEEFHLMQLGDIGHLNLGEQTYI